MNQAKNIAQLRHHVNYVGVVSQRIKHCFKTALLGYPPLHRNPICFQQKPLKSTTMQARPVLNRYILNPDKRQYKVECAHVIKTNKPEPIEELPDEVLIGWFAHELGHLIDYHRRSIQSLVGLGLGYLFSEKMKQEAEKRADLYAIRFGFTREILATKRYILSHSDMSEAYKSQIRRYYLSPEDVEKMIKDQDGSLLNVDDVQLF